MMLLGKIGTGILGTVLVAGGIVSSQGFLHVRVLETRRNGTHLHLILPAMVVPIALRLVPRERLERAARQVQPWLPAIGAAATQLANCPDGSLVEVTEPDQQVRVAKTDGSIVVDVNDPGEAVHVSVPLATVRSAANVIAGRGAPE